MNSPTRLSHGLHKLCGIPGMLFVTIVLGACSTVSVKTSDFIVPDAVLEASRRPVPSRDLQGLRNRVPAMQLDEIEFSGADGQSLRALAFRHPQARATVLVFGNNAFRVAQQGHVMLQALAPLAVDVIQFDYRGYGRSAGEPSAEAVQSDALAVYDQVRKVAQGPLILHGHSFGSFVASYVASRRQPDALVLEGTSTSARDFVHAQTPWFARPFVRFDLDEALDSFDNRAYLRSYRGRVMILVGQNDKMTPVRQGRALLDAISGHGQRLVEVPNADHMSAMHKPEARAAYATLIETVAGAQQ